MTFLGENGSGGGIGGGGRAGIKLPVLGGDTALPAPHCASHPLPPFAHGLYGFPSLASFGRGLTGGLVGVFFLVLISPFISLGFSFWITEGGGRTGRLDPGVSKDWGLGFVSFFVWLFFFFLFVCSFLLFLFLFLSFFFFFGFFPFVWFFSLCFPERDFYSCSPSPNLK